jgi:carbamoyl-phosphate synthase/aspartate carbamoyltransferase/dihydroorotase
LTTLVLPGLVDVHVHVREPGAPHKETWDTGTAAALAGGITTVLAMPNTDPPVVDGPSLRVALDAAAAGARCDYAHYLGATADNAAPAADTAEMAAGLKMYLNQTYGPLRLDDMEAWAEHLSVFPVGRPVVAHAEGHTAGAVILAAHFAGRPIHLCHVSRRDEIEMIHRAKDSGMAVTCEVTPHHLFLDGGDTGRIGAGRATVRPPLGTPDDRKALWDHLEVIDCFATDHAPHRVEEKDGPDPPPGFPGLETALPLLLTAAADGLLSIPDIEKRMATRPREIFGLPEQSDTRVEIDPDEEWVLGDEVVSRAGWTPYAGRRVRGRVSLVVLRGEIAYDGEVRAAPGSGRDLRREEP